MNDEIEYPRQRCLYRQSSIEQRLSPIHMSDESDYDNNDADDLEESKNSNIKKSAEIVDVKLKEVERGVKGQNEHVEKESKGNIMFNDFLIFCKLI